MKQFLAFLLVFAILIPMAAIPAAATGAETTGDPTATTAPTNSDNSDAVVYYGLHYGIIIVAAIALLGISDLIRRKKKSRE